jgi:hypothetical protein
MTGTYAIIGRPIAIAPDLWIQPTLSSPIPATAGWLTTIHTGSLAGATIELTALLGIGNATMIG